jgi:hypothetical protein
MFVDEIYVVFLILNFIWLPVLCLRGGLIDDPNWLPEGPSGREINGVLRFQKGTVGQEV